MNGCFAPPEAAIRVDQGMRVSDSTTSRAQFMNDSTAGLSVRGEARTARTKQNSLIIPPA
jgi:hypothetical protein